MLELVAGVLLAAGLVSFVLQPVWRPAAEPLEREQAGAAGWEEGEDPDDDLSPRAVALRALKEIEFDRATGKLSDTDYDELKGKYTAAAVAALRTEMGNAGSGMRDAAASHTHPVSPIPQPACPMHGPRPEPAAVFCSECGRRLGAAPGYCARCGTVLEREAKYCHSCGARVTA